MNDIVERLRDLARVAEDVPPDFQQIQWLLDAANEIERLREEIHRLKNPAQQRFEGTDLDPLRSEVRRLAQWYREEGT
jgi:hypothetical protein